MSNNDNSSQTGAEQRPGQQRTRENAEQRPEHEQARENVEQRPEQEPTTEQTEAGPEQGLKSEQAEQRPDQSHNTAFAPSPTTMKAEEQKQAQQKRESGLTPEPDAGSAKDIDNVN